MRTRETYIPKNATKVQAKDCAAVFYTYERDTPFGPTISALAFCGKATKPTWHHRFKDKDQRAKRIAHTIAEWQTVETRRAARKAELKAENAKPIALKIGDILDCSWGYDQTNVDFYQVTAFIGKSMVMVRTIGKKAETREGYSDMSNFVTAIPNDFRGAPQRKKVVGTDRDAIQPASHSWASKWDGKPKYCSWYN